MIRGAVVDLTDEQLAQRAQQGCAASFELLVRRFQTPLLHFLQSRAADFNDAEDLLQETFIRAGRHIGRYRPRRRFAPWLFTIAYRLLLNHFRDTRRHRGDDELRALPSPALQPPDQLERRETRTRLWDIARRALTDTQFAILWLHCVEQMSLKEVSRVTGRSQVATRAALFRARKKLLPQLEAAGFGPQARPQRAEATALKSCVA